MKYLKYFKESKSDIIFVRTNSFDNSGTINKLPYSGIQCFAIHQNDLDKYIKELELWGGNSSDVEVVDSTGLTPYALDYGKVHSWVMGDSDVLPELEVFNSSKHTMEFHRQGDKSMLEWISDLGLGRSCYQVILVKDLKRYNESNLDSGGNIVAPIRSEIEDILIEFVSNYDIKFVHYFFGYETSYFDDNFQLQILPKGYPDSGDVEPILIDGDILSDLLRVCSFIKNEIDFKYSHSYYFINHDYKNINRDVFESEGKLVTMIQMFFIKQNRVL